MWKKTKMIYKKLAFAKKGCAMLYVKHSFKVNKYTVKYLRG